ncbi:ComEA family DNA-binding protein [Actinomadura hibisca]|uniref:ComEA family DNA-binding protein n=1 Tax=Actinomadura hibisca TaxID=68565 RepID=UPI00082E053F|nr:helix-hairpin-helix domain-containing protein [Actinomadura hibisca]
MNDDLDDPFGPDASGRPGPGGRPRATGRPGDGPRPGEVRPPRPPRPRHRPPHQPPHQPPPMPPPGWRAPYPLPPRPPHPELPPEEHEPQGILWAFVPFLTLGLGTPFSFLYAAVRRGSWNLGATAAGYGGALTMVFMLLNMPDPVLAMLGGLMMTTLWIAGTVHAFAVRPSAFPRAPVMNQGNRHAIRVARYRRTLREEARQLVAEDPALAHELRIGRPDLPGAFDDGGLIDVNHAPPQVLSTLPGMTPDLVERIGRRRREHGGFISAEELAVDVDLPPDRLPKIAEYAVFLP